MICIMSPFPLFLSASPGTLTKSQVGLTPGVCLLEAERRPLSPKDTSGTGGPGAKLYSALSTPLLKGLEMPSLPLGWEGGWRRDTADFPSRQRSGTDLVKIVTAESDSDISHACSSHNRGSPATLWLKTNLGDFVPCPAPAPKPKCFGNLHSCPLM